MLSDVRRPRGVHRTPTAARAAGADRALCGGLEAYKNIDGLAAAWRQVAGSLAGAQLHIVGEGGRANVVRALRDELPGRVSWTPRLEAAGVAAALDAASVLVLPSRSEGWVAW